MAKALTVYRRHMNVDIRPFRESTLQPPFQGGFCGLRPTLRQQAGEAGR